MSYETFSESPIGTVRNLNVSFGEISFFKSSSYSWFVEVSLRNGEPFLYSNFTQVLTTAEASALFDKYSKR